MSLLDQYRVTPENTAKEKSLLERYRHKASPENSATDEKPEQKKEFPLEEDNDLVRQIERNVARGTSRMAETVLGMPGDLYSFAKGLLGYDKETVLPTSENLKDLSEKYSMGYTKPQSEVEEKSDELLQDIASFMVPGSPKYTIARNLGIPVIANLAKEGVKYAAGEKSAEAVKVGTMIALDLMNLNKGGAKKFAGDLFNESEKLIPKGARLKSPTLQKSISELKKELKSGGFAASKEKALDKISEIQARMKKGDIEVRELIDFRKSINEIKGQLGGYEVQLPKSIKKKAIAYLDKVKGDVIDALEEYGTKQNPEFLKINRSANEAYAAYESSDKIATFIKKTVKDAIKNPGLKTILGVGGAVMHGASIAKATAFGAVPALVAYESYKILHQVIQSPTLRKYYGNILKGGATGNASQVSRNVKAMDKEMEKESP